NQVARAPAGPHASEMPRPRVSPSLSHSLRSRRRPCPQRAMTNRSVGPVAFRTWQAAGIAREGKTDLAWSQVSRGSSTDVGSRARPDAYFTQTVPGARDGQ